MSNPSGSIPSSDPLDSSWLNDPLNYAIKCFVAFLQSIFEKAPNGAFHWSPDPRVTEVVITEENPVNIESVERRPVISVVEGPVRFSGTSLDDLVRHNVRTGEEFHTDLLPGTMSLNCLSRVRQEARFLAWISARTIWNLRKLFIKETYFQEVGRNISIGSVTPAGALVQGDTEGEWHSCSVSCPFFLQWADTVTPLLTDWSGAPIRNLREIHGRIETRMAATEKPKGDTKYWGAAPPRIRGRAIRIATREEPEREPDPSGQSKTLRQGYKI